jgi:Flp pilus assembly protein TadG
MTEGVKNRTDTMERSGSTRFGGFGRNSSGASAIEFAIVAAPFLVLLFLILEVGLVYLANGELENAVAEGARLIRPGEAQSQGFDAGGFKAEVCKYLTALLSCGHLNLDVRTFSSFGGTDLTNPLDSSGNLKSGFSYQPGVGGQVVIVRAFYEWDLPAKFPKAIRNLQISLSNMQDGNLLLIATQVFRNEPFK